MKVSNLSSELSCPAINSSRSSPGRRRDKINHWIMKLGSMIPADGSNVEIGDRLSIAKVEGQSKGGILSKACEYIQSLQQKQLYDPLSAFLRSKSTDSEPFPVAENRHSA